jgi:hypothetical protein
MKVLEEHSIAHEPRDFSVVLGGPLYQLWRRSRLTGDALELVHRRLIVSVLVSWLPLLILSAAAGRAWGSAVKVPFLLDIESNVRFLVALPLLIVAELVVHRRTRVVARRFVDRGIVSLADLPKFDAAVAWAMRIRNSVVLEVALLILAWTVGHWIWRSQHAPSIATWYAVNDAVSRHLTPAGYWYAFVSTPIFQFILLRWYVRIFIWFAFLWRVCRLPLHLMCTHPDRAGGIGFLGKTAYAYAPLLFAQGALLSGTIANRVLYEGDKLLFFKMEAIGLVAFFVLIVLGPLTMFTPRLAEAKRAGQAAYGMLAAEYAHEFEEKWVIKKAPHHDQLLGSADIQSLADLANSYDVVKEMRIVPFGFDDLSRLAVATAAPLVPLGLLVVSPEELLMTLVKILF